MEYKHYKLNSCTTNAISHFNLNKPKKLLIER